MLVKVFTLRFDSVIGCFDDTFLRDFIKDKEVLSIRDHFFVKDNIPYLVLIVKYQLKPAIVPSEKSKSLKEKKEKWREILTEETLPLFNTLRDWRSERSKKDGVPPYVICTNQQLAIMVKNRPESLSSLMEIEGFGKGKSEKYGKEILYLLSNHCGTDGFKSGFGVNCIAGEK